MLCAHINLFAHVRGMALARLEEAQAEKDTGMSADDWMRHHDRGLRQWADSAGHPGLGYAIREPFDFDLDTVFEYGLQRLLDGLDARRRALLALVLGGCAWGCAWDLCATRAIRDREPSIIDVVPGALVE
jgi:hypothetical protein